jgi:putative ABC transport system permease protein
MSPRDLWRFAGRAVGAHRVRTSLTLGATAVGVAAVVILTGLGEGARRYVTDEFKALGSNLLIVVPGKVETTGAVPVLGGTTRELTLADAQAVARRCPRIRHVAPVSVGTATAVVGGRGRTITIVGATQEYFTIRDLGVESGAPLPPLDPRQGMRVCVIGRTVQRELFASQNPLGAILKIGEWRFRVIGILEHKGEALGMDIDDIVIMPVATAMQLLNRRGLFRIMAQGRAVAELPLAREELRRVLIERHDDDEDFTLVEQGSMLSALDAILRVLTMAVAGIAAISLAVAGLGIMNVMLVSVAERTGEIGLMKAVGAGDRQILAIFLTEAVTLSGAGGLVGLALGATGSLVLRALIGGLDATPPGWSVAAALGTALGVGIVFGLLPARRASRVDPVVALSKGRG